MTFDYRATIISQYANSPTLLALLAAVDNWYDQTANIEGFYKNIWNIATATGYGLQVWGRIVGVSNVLEVPNPTLFGFAGTGNRTFGFGTFYSGQNSTSNFTLTDDAYRVLIYAKCLFNISGSAAPDVNTILRELFPGRGNAYAVDEGNMHARLNFEFVLKPFERAILQQSGVFVGPTGVKMFASEIPRNGRFGFAQAASSASFGHGTFYGGSYVI